MWRTILSLGIEKDDYKPTHRGVRAGLKVKQKRITRSSKLPSTPIIDVDRNLLNVCHWNARSIKNKTTTCSDFITDQNVDIMFLTETWLSVDSHQVAINEVAPPGYNFINIPRKTDDHGGIGILHKKQLKLHVHPPDFVAETFEHAIISDKERKIYFVVVYRPPPSTENRFTTSKFLSEFDEFLLHITTLSNKTFLLGDFNVHVDIPTKPDARHFLALIEGSGLHQHVVGPTHKHGHRHTLDLVLSRLDENLVNKCTIGPRFSDHHVIECKLNIERPGEQKEVITTRKFRSIDPKAFDNDFKLNLETVSQTSDDINTVTEHFETATNLTLEAHAPVSTRTCSQRVRQPWYNTDIHEARRIRRKHEKKWRKTGLEVHHKLYLTQNNLVNTMIENSKKAFLREKLKDADSKSAFRTVKGLLNNNDIRFCLYMIHYNVYVQTLPCTLKKKLITSNVV